jgi:hypothetical protein
VGPELGRFGQFGDGLRVATHFAISGTEAEAVISVVRDEENGFLQAAEAGFCLLNEALANAQVIPSDGERSI